MNSLLKNSVSFEDKWEVFRYDDIAETIQHHSYDIERNLELLLHQMLFNSTIDKTDDHERNFSFIIDHNSYALSPAYDMVPSLTMGQHPMQVSGIQLFCPRPRIAQEIGVVENNRKKIIQHIMPTVTVGSSLGPAINPMGK